MMSLLPLLLSVTLVTAGHYDGHQVMRVFPKLRSDVDAVLAVGEELGVDFWHYPHSVNDSFHVRVSPQLRQPFMTEMKSLGLEVNVFMDNLQMHIDRERADMQRNRRAASKTGKMDFSSYHTLEYIENYVDKLQSNEIAHVSVEKLSPATVEGRNLRLVRISREPNTGKQIIFIDCGIHAREWVTPPFCLYAIEQLMGESDPNNEMLDLYDWMIIPVANPDGYVYSHNEERMWRKNRRKAPPGYSLTCSGVDLNRNFDYHFGGASTSTNPCSDLYHGGSAFSENESLAIASVAEQYKGLIKAYLNVHAYSQLWMTPYGFSSDVKPDNDEQLKCVGEKAITALRSRYNTRYQVGPPGEFIYDAAGGSFDWMKGKMDVSFSYALELRDTGRYMFLLPEKQILPTAEETWDGVQAMAREIFSGEC